MKKRYMKKLNNDGYSLVEFVIVIAIIAVLTAAAVVTLSVIHTARAKDASMSFNTAVNDLKSTTQGRSYDFNNNGVVNDVDDKTFNFGLRIYSDGSKCYIQKVMVKSGVYLANVDYEEANNLNNGKGTSLSSSVYVTHTPVSGSETKVQSGSYEVVICFNKDGSCKLGAGTYRFYRENGSSIAKITVNRNGSILAN